MDSRILGGHQNALQRTGRSFGSELALTLAARVAKVVQRLDTYLSFRSACSLVFLLTQRRHELLTSRRRRGQSTRSL